MHCLSEILLSADEDSVFLPTGALLLFSHSHLILSHILIDPFLSSPRLTSVLVFLYFSPSFLLVSFFSVPQSPLFLLSFLFLPLPLFSFSWSDQHDVKTTFCTETPRLLPDSGIL